MFSSVNGGLPIRSWRSRGREHCVFVAETHHRINIAGIKGFDPGVVNCVECRQLRLTE